MVGIPIQEGVESLEEVINQSLKLVSTLGKQTSNLGVYEISNDVSNQDLK